MGNINKKKYLLNLKRRVLVYIKKDYERMEYEASRRISKNDMVLRKVLRRKAS